MNASQACAGLSPSADLTRLRQSVERLTKKRSFPRPHNCFVCGGIRCIRARFRRTGIRTDRWHRLCKGDLSRPLRLKNMNAVDTTNSARIETTVACSDSNAAATQRVPLAWTDCSWTPKVSRIARVRSARRFAVRYFTDIPETVERKLRGVKSCPFFE